LTEAVRSIKPRIGPDDTPWSMGTITVLPVFRSNNLSSLIDLPIMVGTSLP
jgi:hypothetical protein